MQTDSAFNFLFFYFFPGGTPVRGVCRACLAGFGLISRIAELIA
jgi:hypothetical protein